MAHIQIRIDYEDKQAAQTVLDGLGLNFSSAIKLFLKQMVREQKLPFEVSVVGSVPKVAPTKPVPASGFSTRKIG